MTRLTSGSDRCHGETKLRNAVDGGVGHLRWIRLLEKAVAHHSCPVRSGFLALPYILYRPVDMCISTHHEKYGATSVDEAD